MHGALIRLVEQVVEFAESLDGKRAGRFQEHLEYAGPVAPDKRARTALRSSSVFSRNLGTCIRA